MGAHVPSPDAVAPHAPDSSEMHNASVDENAAAQGGCGQVYLPNGKMCTLRHGHDGSCEFSRAEEAEASLARHRADEGW
jgi:hypothetical protein